MYAQRGLVPLAGEWFNQHLLWINGQLSPITPLLCQTQSLLQKLWDSVLEFCTDYYNSVICVYNSHSYWVLLWVRTQPDSIAEGIECSPPHCRQPLVTDPCKHGCDFPATQHGADPLAGFVSKPMPFVSLCCRIKLGAMKSFHSIQESFKCNFHLYCRKFSAEECWYSLAVEQSNLNEFTFLAYLVPICPQPLLGAQCP